MTSFPTSAPRETGKVVSLAEAAARVRSGDQVITSAGGAWAPMAVLREVLRRGARDLRLIGVVGGGLNMDLPIGAGAVASVDTCHVAVPPVARTGPNFSRHVTAGRVRSLDNT